MMNWSTETKRSALDESDDIKFHKNRPKSRHEKPQKSQVAAAQHKQTTAQREAQASRMLVTGARVAALAG